MSILDDAIREHLELKRAHGADEAEIKKLEDEAFGPPGRPGEGDSLAEAPTEFMTTPEAAESSEEGRRRINIADLQEPPAPPPLQEEPQVEVKEAIEPPEAEAPVAPAEDPAQAAPPAEEELLAEEEPRAEEEPPELGERQAIAEQPTEFFDVEAEMGTEDAPVPATEAPSPSDEEIAAAEAAEPKLAPVEPATEIYAARTEPLAEEFADEEEEDEEFWSDQRLSDELDQALEAPLPLAEELADEEDEDEPLAEEPRAEDEEDERSHADYDPDTGHEDVLEDTPDFLEDAPEDDELWFEQRPPKDFDLD